MKIMVDTQKDSKEEIKKAIKLLMSLISDSPVYTNEPEKIKNLFEGEGSSTPQASVFGNIFDEPKEKKEKKEQMIEFY